jgi:hypothetical protein
MYSQCGIEKKYRFQENPPNKACFTEISTDSIFLIKKKE